ncbi:hypothetical protein ACQPXM_24185 [Kribbella sp. CA-253562]|uniref:hypothetical protein n=1 Tax=Kribbella sp. CA-253562 TaxID=3239942 RepID=UPI003D922A55
MNRTIRSFCLYLATTVGLVCTIVTWGVLAALASGVLFALAVGAIASAVWAEDVRRAASRIARVALAAAVLAPAAMGLLAVFGFAGLLVVLALAVTTPGFTSLVRTRRAADRGPSPVRPDFGVPNVAVPPMRRAVPPMTGPLPDAGSLDDEALCLAWRRSFVQLEAARSAAERLAVVERRQQYLDELHRRSPQGLAAWLASGARASGNPLPYVGDTWRRAS